MLNDAEEARRCELWRLQGVERFADGELDATLAGGKHNLTDIAARIGLGQLARLEEFTARRHALARRYFECFDRSLGCELPLEDFTQQQLAHVPDRAAAAGAARAPSSRHARGGHRHRRALSGDPPADAVPRAWASSRAIFRTPSASARGIATLPLFPAMREQDVDRVCGQVARILNRS